LLCLQQPDQHEMRAQIVSFLKLLQGNVRYSVPRWQRRYSWDKKTIDRLVQDLKAIAQVRDENVQHFGGTLITYSESTPPGTPALDHVVDGQQRLATISILLICIARELGPNGKAGQWNAQKIWDILLKNSLDSSITMELQGEDDEEYRRILEGQPRGEGKVTAAWKILRKATTDVGPSRLMGGLNRFQVISFRCGPSDDPQQIFESLNATGVPLTEGEKAKNWLLMGLDRKAQDEVYRGYWCVLETYLGAVQEPKYIDEFLRDFLRWKTGENSGKTRTYENLRRWWHVSNTENDRIWLCKDLARLAELYGIITGRGDKYKNKRINQLLKYFRGLGIDVLRPLILRLLDDATRPDSTGATAKELIETLEAISTWLTRLWLAGKPTNGLNTEAARLAHGKGPRYTEDFSHHWTGEIRKLRRSRIAVPSAEEVREGIKKRKAYGSKASGAAKAILYTINSEIWKGPAQPRIEDLSLEHIMPRTLGKEWENYLGDDVDEIRDNYLNSLVNLTLVGLDFNSEISNRGYNEKRELYKESSVTLTRQLSEQHADWKENDLVERGEELAEWALKCWPWEDRPLKGPRWRMNSGEWKGERSYRRVLLSVTAALLDIDPEGNYKRLSGNRKNIDIFPAESPPIAGPGSRFVQIPRHESYVINVHASRESIITRCRKMSQRCGEDVDVE